MKKEAQAKELRYLDFRPSEQFYSQVDVPPKGSKRNLKHLWLIELPEDQETYRQQPLKKINYRPEMVFQMDGITMTLTVAKQRPPCDVLLVPYLTQKLEFQPGTSLRPSLNIKFQKLVSIQPGDLYVKRVVLGQSKTFLAFVKVTKQSVNHCFERGLQQFKDFLANQKFNIETVGLCYSEEWIQLDSLVSILRNNPVCDPVRFMVTVQSMYDFTKLSSRLCSHFSDSKEMECKGYQ